MHTHIRTEFWHAWNSSTHKMYTNILLCTWKNMHANFQFFNPCQHHAFCQRFFIQLYLKGECIFTSFQAKIPSAFLLASWPERSWSLTLILLWVFGMDNSNSCLFEMNFVRWNPDSLAHIHDSFYELFCKFNTFQ